MKRFVVFAAVLVAVFSLAASDFGLAAHRERVTLCHVITNVERPNGIVWFSGRIIEVNSRAAARHQMNHGDVPLEGDAIDEFSPNGTCCAFTVMLNGEIRPGRVD